MKASLRWSLALFLVAGLLSGCGKNETSPVSRLVSPAGGTGPGGTPPAANDQAEASAALAQAPELIEDGQFESPDQGSIGGVPGTIAAIHPLFYWRNIVDVERRFEFAFTDSDSAGRPTTAIVTVHKFLKGSFNIAAGERPEGITRDSANVTIVHKRLADHWVRRLLLRRVPCDHDDRRMWRVAASSGVEVTSKDATTRILSLKIETATRETTLTDPLAFFRLRRILKFGPGEEVKLTVTTERNDDVVVLVFRGLRSMFHNNGDNTYTGLWRAPLLPGLHHVGVNALSRGTLFDDVLPYDSNAWIVPCLVPPTELAEFIP